MEMDDYIQSGYRKKSWSFKHMKLASELLALHMVSPHAHIILCAESSHKTGIRAGLGSRTGGAGQGRP